MTRKILAAFLLAFVAIVMALVITRFSFREMMSTVDHLSEPNEKLTMLNRVFEEITMLDQQQRAEAIKNPLKPYKYFLDQSQFLHDMIDSLKTMHWDSIQLNRLNSMKDLLDRRNQIFVSYMKVKADLSDNHEFSRQLDTLSTLLKESKFETDSSIVTTQKKTVTTYFQDDTLRQKDNRSLLKKIFSKKKKENTAQAQVKVQEELSVVVDTLAVARQNVAIDEVEKMMRDLEFDQLSQRKKLQRKELELIHANSIFINQLLNTLHEVEHEELIYMRKNNREAAHVVSRSMSRINILMFAFFLAAALLVYLIWLDISRSNYYKEQLEKARDEAEELSQIKQRFLANMSHEIRTPLQSIIGFAEQLKHHHGSSRDAIDAIHSSSEHLLHIVNEVLDYSRISSGNFKLAKENFRLLALVREVESAIRIQAENKRLAFMMECDQAHEYLLHGDAFRLRQILYNLLGNAIKFTQRGFIKLRVKTDEKDNLVTCLFEITDSGIGIRQDDLNKIFNQFEQANSNIARHYGGTGLGLTIVKSLVDAQHGKLEVTSAPGHGSTFSIEIQYEKAIGPALAQALPPAPYPITSYSGKVIVVDDDLMILRLCSLILRKNHIQHAVYADAESILEQSPDAEVTHILLDIRMPNTNGVDLCKKLKSKYKKEICFVALTAHVLPEERENLLTEGFDKILSKPFHEHELLTLLDITQPYKDIPVVDAVPDFTLVRQMTMGDQDLFQSIITQFVHETSIDLTRLDECLKHKDSVAVRDVIHKMAGRTGQMGVHSLSTRLQHVEENLVSGKDTDELGKEIAQAKQEMNQLLKTIKEVKC
ncbi:MAG: hybrid sensor histidine kinase/response regulator [Bacteroidota bacterium]